MTNEEIIIMLYGMKAEADVTLNAERLDGLGKAINALEKQIPKKPTVTYHCPTCEADIIRGGNYCWNCGQAIDFSDDET